MATVTVRTTSATPRLPTPNARAAGGCLGCCGFAVAATACFVVLAACFKVVLWAIGWASN